MSHITPVYIHPSPITGWDIGGANLKAARLGPDGLAIVQQPFAVWQRRDELATALRAMAQELGPAPVAGITMTAELSDAFRTKREGVQFVLDAVQTALPGTDVRVWGVDGSFHSVETAHAQPLLVAAANWLATALMVAQHLPNGLLVDTGSTTTDIIPLVEGAVAARGTTDPQRLLQSELVYTGVQRTPIHAIVQCVPLWGGWCPVAAEYFATAQDVHLLLGDLSPDQATTPTADGRPATPAYAAERLARMVCADTEMLDHDQIIKIAHYVAAAQVEQIAAGLAQVQSAHQITGPVVVAGVGSFLVNRAAQRLGLVCEPLGARLGEAASAAAPAAALALLMAQQAQP